MGGQAKKGDKFKLKRKYFSNIKAYIYGKNRNFLINSLSNKIFYKSSLTLNEAIRNLNNNIKNFYYFPSGRWDIEMNSGVLIKLPITRIKESLNLSIDLLDDIEFSNIKILDIRQKNQIVIND